MSLSGEVLIAILNNPDAFKRARDEHWYHIPVSRARKWMKGRWPPRWLAFYQTKIFGDEAHAVNYFADVADIREVPRLTLFPDETAHERAGQPYYQVLLGPLQKLPKAIPSRRLRRIVFIPTTWEKLVHAAEINDLFDDSRLEDTLWTQFKRMKIPAERQEFVHVHGRNYFLDFAVYCTDGNLDVETDGDYWHADRAQIPRDNQRDNDLETAGWKLLRFNSYQIAEQMADYCIPLIAENVNKLGGPEEGRIVPRKIDPRSPGSYQLGLFDD
jgi:very-short-patch-repair endonuclease